MNESNERTSKCAMLCSRCKEWAGSKLAAIRDSRIYGYLRPSRHVKFLAWILLAGLVSFMIIRVVLIVRNAELLKAGFDATNRDIANALFMGLRYDLALVYYLIVPGLILLAISQYMGKHARWMRHATIAILSLVFSLSLMCCIGNIPFFEYTGAFVNALGLRYVMGDAGQAFDMVFGNLEYVIFFFAAIISSVLFTLLIIYLSRRYRIGEPSKHRLRTTIYLLLLVTLVPLTSRGLSFQKSPLTIKDSCISNNNFINQACINPVIPFLESLVLLFDQDIHLMNSEVAREYVIEEYHRDKDFNEHVTAHESPFRNVVFILQEGNGAVRLERNGDTRGLLPNLDRLINEGLYFDYTFSTCSYTAYGIYSTVTSMPSYMHNHPLTDGLRQNLHGAFDQLESSGKMSTIFLLPHNADFDNAGNFIPLQGFGKFISELDYGPKTGKVWGVDDHVLFDRAIQEMDSEYAKGKNFACVCLTCSNHKPYDPPTVSGFNTDYPNNLEYRTIQYADWAMNNFLEKCKKKEWFDETLFVITADHGCYVDDGYVASQGWFHIPLLFYAPKHIPHEIRHDLASQMDIVPTAMGMLGIEWDNHTFGIDLMSQQRRMIPSTFHALILARDHDWLYISNPKENINYLYDLHASGDDRFINAINGHEDVADKMDLYVKAVVQAGWDMHNTPMGK